MTRKPKISGGYQPLYTALDPSKPPQGGSGVPLSTMQRIEEINKRLDKLENDIKLVKIHADAFQEVLEIWKKLQVAFGSGPRV